MMQAKRTELTTYLCGFAFLMGGMIGCLTGYLCSDRAYDHLTAFLLCWHAYDPSCTCFAAELLIAVFALILSLTALGPALIPVLLSVSGYSLGLIIFIAIHSALIAGFQPVFWIAFVPDVLVILCISERCSEISKQITRSWTSCGARTFHLGYLLRRIWIFLVFLVGLFCFHCILYSRYFIL